MGAGNHRVADKRKDRRKVKRKDERKQGRKKRRAGREARPRESQLYAGHANVPRE